MNKYIKHLIILFLIVQSIISIEIPGHSIGYQATKEDSRITIAKYKEEHKNTDKSLEYIKQKIEREKKLKREKENGYLVKFKEEATEQQKINLLSKYANNSIGNKKNKTYRIYGKKMAEQIRKSNVVEYIEEDILVKQNIIPNDTYYSYQWNLPMINVPKAWNTTIGKNSVIVAVIDSGLYYEHPDLNGNNIYMGWNYIYDEVNDFDSNGHGTNVTGIIHANSNNAYGIAGLNWDVTILPLNCFYSDGTAYLSDITTAIYEAVDIFNCKVINISSGSSKYSPTYRRAVDYAASKGVIIVASAGNDGDTTMNYPAGYNNVIGVGSVNSSKQRSWFSQKNSSVFVTAPGESVLTLNDPYYKGGYNFIYASGTSFSAPHVSGLAALIASVKPDLNITSFKEILENSSIDLGSDGYDYEYGYGLINVEAAIDRALGVIKVEAIDVLGPELIYTNGITAQYSLSISPTTASNKTVVWSVDNTSVATIDPVTGLLTPVNNGKLTVKAAAIDGSEVFSEKSVQITEQALPLGIINKNFDIAEGDLYFENEYLFNFTYKNYSSIQKTGNLYIVFYDGFRIVEICNTDIDIIPLGLQEIDKRILLDTNINVTNIKAMVFESGTLKPIALPEIFIQ